MSDIHQEWKELRQKNGDFINHLDGEMAKLKQDKQLQDLLDAGAFVMQFIAPPQFNCCQDDRDILKALNKAQTDRIKYLEDELLARKEQQQVDLAIKKDLDEKLDKAATDYKALWVEKEDLKERVVNLQKQLITTRNELADFTAMYDKAAEEAHQAKVAKDRMGYSNRCMQSKIAKQANEIKRLTEENKCLHGAYDSVSHEYLDLEKQFKASKVESKLLHEALDAAAKDADANFERGKIKGMEEIWDELRETYRNRILHENEKIFGYGPVGEIVDNLSPTWFMNKAREYHEQKEKEEARDIKIGDEVEIFDPFCPDDDPNSDIGIVIAIDKDHPCFTVIGPKFEGCFDETDIDAGIAKKTGRHFDKIPLDYLA